ncbi:SulP family inorganic anion transporter [Poseidonocella sp. HB161398]|uniref:SulP family inorganic anion transporter n=1 Tax=Poseidonocella sp. HB161398 TaxID=2320855 RepID=UPI0011085065|nr:sulfate permease [Poseidonocella sp. HB161398]
MRPDLKRFFPILDWGRRYTGETLTNDLVAAVIVTIMLIPQSLAYSLLAGLPPEIGLYASVAPLVLYAVFGTSRALAVGPVAVVSLMTGAAIGRLGITEPAAMIGAAVTMAFLSGAILLALGVFRLGFLANFLSHPVIAGFITASGILIAVSQLKHILGVSAGGDTLPDQLEALWHALPQTNLWTLAIGLLALGFLFWGRTGLKPLLQKAGLRPKMAGIAAKAGPVAAVIATTAAVAALRLDEAGVPIVGDIPRGFPGLALPGFDLGQWAQMAVPALMLSIIGFVESVSVAQTFAARRRQRIDPDQELVALGMSNFGSSLSGGLPVTGGFSRSVVNFDAGAETPAAGAFTAVGIGLAVMFLTPLLYFLPKATLAATIIVAVLSLVDFSILKKTWSYSRADFASVLATILVTLGLGVEAGVSAGVGLSIALHLFKTARPHVAEVGCVPGTEHFRNIRRHEVATEPSIVTIRVDESLYFANARFLEDYVYDRVVKDKAIRHVVLMCPAVNDIDMSALESLEAINHRLHEMGITLHMSEVKGPVMDRLQKSHFLEELTGKVYLSQFAAMRDLLPKPDRAAAAE